jgi:hypothetical protein
MNTDPDLRVCADQQSRVVHHWLQYYDRAALGKELEDHGFVAEEFLGDVAGAAFDPQAVQFAAVARKPGQA